MKKNYMKKIYTRFLACFFTITMVLTGCGDETNAGTDSQAEQNASSGQGTVSQTAGSATLDVAALFSDRDKEIGYAEEECVKISLTGGTASVQGSGVTVEGNKIIINEEGSYLLTGSLSGSVVVDTDKNNKVQLILDDVEIQCEGSAALYIKQADKVFITTAPGSENRMTSTGEFIAIDDNNIDGAIFAKDDVTFSGTGALTIYCETGHGIVCKNDLKITGGSYQITAEKHGLQGKDSVRILDGKIVIEAKGDGIHSGNDEDETVGYTYIGGGEITLAVEDDGIHSDTDLVIAGGKIDVTKSYEGLESKNIEILGGTISVKASDDGINATGGNTASQNTGTDNGRRFDNPFSAEEGVIITISGGKITVDADGDGIDSNGDLIVSGGEVIVYGPTNGGNGALDYNGEAMISGGTVIAMGSSQMAENFGEKSSQGAIMVNSQEMLQAGTVVELSDEAGKTILSCTAKKSYNSVVFSCPEIQVGKTYKVNMADRSETVEMTTVIYGAGMGFGGGFGGGHGGFGGGRGGFGGDSEKAPEGFAPGQRQKPQNMQ